MFRYFKLVDNRNNCNNNNNKSKQTIIEALNFPNSADIQKQSNGHPSTILYFHE